MEYYPGKVRGLQATANSAGAFTILALDHGASFLGAVRPRDPTSLVYADVVALKGELLAALAPHASAVLLDPVYGLPAGVLAGALPGKVGLLLSVEDGDYAEAQAGGGGRTLPGWSVSKIRRAGGAAVKLFFYYHPEDEPRTRAQEELVRQVARDCRRHDLPLFAEPVTYGVAPGERRRIVLETARRISGLDIDVLKIEFPVDVAAEPDEMAWATACCELTAACRVPWTLLSAGVNYNIFARQIQVACQAGASGFLVGRALWQDVVAQPAEARTDYLQQVTIPRLQALAQMATAAARPWHDCYPYPAGPPAPDWYVRYDSIVAGDE